MFCATPVAGARPTKCFGQGNWASSDPTMIGGGAQDISKPVSVAVQESFTTRASESVSCSQLGCGVFVRRDHMDPTDKSLDTFVPVAFAPVFGVQVSKTSNLIRVEDTVAVTVAGLPKATGVYVRECAKSATKDRPTLCDGQGIWATNDSQWLAYGATDVSSPLTLKVHESFISNSQTVDCDKVKCGIFVRRDHMAPTDKSFDTYVPIAFAKLRKDTAKVAGVKNSGKVNVVLSGNIGDVFTLTVNGAQQSVTLSANTQTIKVSAPKKTTATVSVSVSGTALVSTQVNI